MKKNDSYYYSSQIDIKVTSSLYFPILWIKIIPACMENGLKDNVGHFCAMLCWIQSEIGRGFSSEISEQFNKYPFKYEAL